MAQAAFEGWAILEQLGHRRTAGLVSEVELFGAKMGRIDIPRPDGSFTSHFFGAGSVYGLTPTSEENARAVAEHNQPRPIHSYELPAPASRPAPSRGYLPRPDDEEDVTLVDPEDEDRGF